MTTSAIHQRLLLLGLFSVALLLGSANSADSTTTSPATPCEICRDTGQCSTAYQGAPAKYCRDEKLYSGDTPTACCCGADDLCASVGRSNFCSCTTKPTKTFSDRVWILLGCLILGVLAIGTPFALRARKRRRQLRNDNHVDVHVQTVIYANPQQPGYPQQAIYPQQAVYPQQVPAYASGYPTS